MSFELILDALAHQFASHRASGQERRSRSQSLKLTLLVLAEHADEERSCFVGMKRLCTRTSMSERAVQYALRDLEAMGLIEIVRRVDRSSRFRITEQLPPAPRGVKRQRELPFSGRDAARRAPDAARRAPDAARRAPDAARRAPISILEALPKHSGKHSGNQENAERAAGKGQLTEARKKIATDLQLDPLTSWAAFTDYYAAGMGAAADTDASWRSWCRKRAALAKTGRLGPGVHSPETRKLSEEQAQHSIYQRAAHHLGGATAYIGRGEGPGNAGESLDVYRARIETWISDSQHRDRFGGSRDVSNVVSNLAAAKKVKK